MAHGKMGGSSEKEGKAWGKGQFANMPSEKKMQSYPKAHEAGPMVEDDTMTRIDAENGRAQKKSRRFMSNQH